MSRRWDKSPRGKRLRRDWWIASYRNSHDEYSVARRRRWRALRQEVIDAYGGGCRCCGETILEFLGLNHKKGGGRQHRMQVGGTRLYQILRAEIRKGIIRRDEYDVLCHNCNQAEGAYGICPHESL